MSSTTASLTLQTTDVQNRGSRYIVQLVCGIAIIWDSGSTQANGTYSGAIPGPTIFASIPVPGSGATYCFLRAGNQFSWDVVGITGGTYTYDSTTAEVSDATWQFFGSGEKTCENDPTATAAEPVNTYSGNYTTPTTDFALAGRGIPFAFVRTYNSLSPDAGGPLGQGWTHAYAASLHFTATTVSFVGEDGAAIPFAPDGSGSYTGGLGVLATLATETGGYVLTRPDQLRYHFDSAGTLLRENDRNGNTLTFAYTIGDLATVTDTVGRTINLTYANHHLTGLAGPLGRTVSYAYDTSGRLRTVTDVRGGVVTYGYDTAGRLTTITDANNHVLVTNVYDATSGRVTDQFDARTKHTTFGWNPATQTSTVTDPLGHTITDVYDGPKLVSRQDGAGNLTTFGYDATYNVTSILDARGKTTTMTHDARGNLLTVTAPAPLSYVQTFTYDSKNDLLTATDGRNHTTTNTYDTAGNLTRATLHDTTFVALTRDPAGTGLLASVTDPRGKTTTYGYDSAANVTAVGSPMSETTSLTYDAAGRLLTTVEPRGNAAGATPSQYTTSYGYDAADHLTSVTDAIGNTTTFAFDPAGNRTGVTDPNTHTTTYSYDAANHLAGVTDGDTKTTSYGYDDASNLISRTDPKSHTTTWAYDGANRVTTETDPLGHAWTVGYDANGNPTTRTDANGHTTALAYDEVNRLTGVTYSNPSTHSVTLGYDANGNRTSMVDGAGTETYALDNLDRVIGVTRGSDSFGYTYDANGNLLTRVYPGGKTTTYTYDDDNRMASASAVAQVAPPADTTAPTAPSGLNATAAGNNRIDLAWTASTDAVGVQGYKLYRNGTYLSAIGPVGTMSLTDLALAAATLYSYTVSAIDGAGNESPPSAAASATTAPLDTVAPTVPTGVGATAPTWNQAVLTWTASADASGVTRYQIFRGGTLLASVAGSVTTFTDRSTAPATAYSYTVRAGDAAGNSSASSTAAPVTTPSGTPPTDGTAPSAPSGLTATTNGTSRIDVAWTTSADTNGVQGYKIYRGGTYLSAIGPVGSVSLADTGLAAGTTYTYKISAIDGAGNESAQSTAASATTVALDTTVPTAPASVTAVATSSRVVTLTWTASTDNVAVIRYTILRGGIQIGVVDPVAGSTQTFVDRTATTGTYAYRIFAADAAGNTSNITDAPSVTTTLPRLRPTSDVSNSGFTPNSGTALWSRLSETTSDGDSSYITTESGSAILAMGGDAASSVTSVTIRWTGRVPQACISCWTWVSLYDGATLLTPYPSLKTLTTSYTTFTWTQSGLSVASTANLRVKLEVSSTSNPARITWLAMDVTGSAVADTTAPTMPTGLSATVASSTQVSLSWTASTDANGVQGYKIYRNGSQVGLPVYGTTFKDVGLAPGTAYTYTVAATDGTGNTSAQSTSAAATTTGADTTAPTVPTGANATPVAWNNVALSWTASTDAVGVTRYLIFRGGTALAVVAGTSTTFADRSTAQSTAYGYTVKAQDEAGNTSAASAASNVTTPAYLPPADTTAPTTPSGLTASAVDTDRVDLSWTASTDAVGVQGYKLYRNGTYVSAIGPIGSLSFSDTGLTPGTAFTYKVSAIDGAGNESGQSTQATATTVSPDTTVPTVPTAMTATSTIWNAVSVTWTASTDATGVSRYTISRNGSLLAVVNGSTTAFTDRSTSASTPYSYTVTASDAAGNASAPSTAASATTPSAPDSTLTTTYGYDPSSNLLAEVSPDGITAKYTYDRAGRLLEVANVTATGTLSRFTYGLDSTGNRTVLTTTRGSRYFSYDAVDRLTGVCYAASCAGGMTSQACLGCVGSPISTPAATLTPSPSDSFTNWTYDAVGNRLTESSYLGIQTYAYDNADRLTSRTPPGLSTVTYAYDNNGNQTAAGADTFAWDLADRLTSATVGPTTETYSWSGDGIRLSSSRGAGAANTTAFVVDRNFGLPQVVQERDGSGSLQRTYTYGGSLISQSTATGSAFYHHDGLGSVSDLTNSAGVSVAWAENQPWGALRTAGSSGAPANAFGFAGQYQDGSTGLLFMRARMYDPATGRFLSLDPAGWTASASRYTYALNNPINFVDPSGWESESPGWGFGPLIVVLGAVAVASLGVACIASGVCEVAGAAAFAACVIACGAARAVVPIAIGVSGTDPGPNPGIAGGIDFVVGPGEAPIIVPHGAVGPSTTTSGRGFQYLGGSGGNGLSPKVTGVRIMDPIVEGPYLYPNGYVSYMNAYGQTIHPFDGSMLSRTDPLAHWPR